MPEQPTGTPESPGLAQMAGLTGKLTRKQVEQFYANQAREKINKGGPHAVTTTKGHKFQHMGKPVKVKSNGAHAHN